MEYVEGETLATRLAKGPLPVDHAIAVATQIAAALDGAHRAGIVHRDLTPANVMLTKAGPDLRWPVHVKLLDFGLAKLRQPVVALSTEATRAADLTMPGTMLGTVQYMAPEQLEGKDTDARTDIFAFGAVLYEMVTGRKAFAGPNHAALIAAILDSQPPRVSSLEPRAPAFLDQVAQRCLMKDPGDRWQSIRDVLIVLELAADWIPASLPLKHVERSRAREWLGWVAAVGFLLITLALVWTELGRGREHTLPARLSILPPERTTFLGGYPAPHLALSPDGRRLAFVPTPIGGRALLWIAWGADGVILFTPRLVGPLYRVSVNGGEAVAATTIEPSRQENNHRLPSFLPDGRHFFFLVQSGTQSTSTVRIGSLDSKETQSIGIVGTDALYAQGFLLFRRDESLMAQPFDLSRLQLEGKAVALGDHVAFRTTVFGDPVFSVAENGTLAYWNGGPLLTDVRWFSRTGEPLGTLATGRGHYSLALSPDERRAAIEMDDDVNQIGNLWMVDVASGIRTRFTSGPPNWGPVWSPNGSRVVFGSLRHGPSSLYEKSASGQSAEQLFLKGSDHFFGVTDWLPDGRAILLQDMTSFKLSMAPA
jgi:hypothetical protein